MDIHIAELKAHLSEHLHAVRGGERITVFDRDTPIAVIAPYASTHGISLRRARCQPNKVKLPEKPIGNQDPVEILLEDRRKIRQ